MAEGRKQPSISVKNAGCSVDLSGIFELLTGKLYYGGGSVTGMCTGSRPLPDAEKQQLDF